MGQINNPKNTIFNSPLEIGLRILFIISESTRPLDYSRLVNYNYLILHSSDVINGPSSIHPSLPQRSCEVAVARNIIKQSLNLLILKNLIKVNYTKKQGIEYLKNANTTEFVSYFQSEYSKNLKERAKWLSSFFDKLTDGQVADVVNSNLGKWGSEFSIIQINSEVKQNV